MDEAGFPAGVFNLVNGDGTGVGSQLSSHKWRGHDQLYRLCAGWEIVFERGRALRKFILNLVVKAPISSFLTLTKKLSNAGFCAV